mgnify:CR=1 FL=1
MLFQLQVVPASYLSVTSSHPVWAIVRVYVDGCDCLLGCRVYFRHQFHGLLPHACSSLVLVRLHSSYMCWGRFPCFLWIVRLTIFKKKYFIFILTLIFWMSILAWYQYSICFENTILYVFIKSTLLSILSLKLSQFVHPTQLSNLWLYWNCIVSTI